MNAHSHAAFTAFRARSSGYTHLPAGEQTLEIVESEYVPTCDGLGMLLKCKAQIVGGEYDGRPYYLNYTLEHADPQREEKGQRDFACVRRATGVLAPDFTDDLHFIPFGVKLGVRENGAGEPVNRIVEYVLPPLAA